MQRCTRPRANEGESSDQTTCVEDPGRIKAGKVLKVIGRRKAGEGGQVVVVLPHCDLRLTVLQDHLVNRDESEHAPLTGRESPSLRMLVRNVGAVGQQQTVVVLVARKRL